MMLEYLNSAACFVMMVYSLPFAMAMGNRGMFVHRMAVAAVQCGLFLQATNPWVLWVPEVSWPTAFLNISAAFMLLIWWRRAWAFARSYLQPVEPEDLEQMRRASDWSEGAPRRNPHVHTYPWSGTPKA